MQTTSEMINLKMMFERDPHAPQAAATESQELKELRAVPIYFASSYSLVKPYVTGFDVNVLDAPSLKKTRLDTNWKPAE